MNSREISYLGLLLLVTFFWGLTFPLIKTTLQYISPLIFLFLRFGLSTLILLPFLRKKKGIFERKSIAYGVTAGTLLFFGYYFQTVGLEYTTASKSGLITGIYVVLIPLMSYLYLKRKVSRYDITASVIAFSGLILMSSGSITNSGVELGDILTLIGAVVYAFQIAYLSKHSSGLDTVIFTFYQLLMVSVLSLLFIPSYPSLQLDLNAYAIFTIAFTAIFAGTFAMFVTTKALIFIEPTAAGIIFVGEPIFAAIASVIIDKEPIGPYTVIGGTIMVFAMFLTTIDKYVKARNSGKNLVL
ncbi:MAG: DMT family transporter [Thermoplasmataceae archaeon]